MKLKYILTTTFLVFLLFACFYRDWVYYLTHHIKNHIHNLTNSYPIHEILGKSKTQKNHLAQKLKISDKGIRKLQLIESVKLYGKKIYHLKTADVYENFVALDRKVLGLNLIAAQPLKLELKKFYFPFIGDFGYLGFFDFDLLKKFKKKYEEQKLDTYTSEIAAFTYLRYFKDPVFSSYLQFQDYQVISLVLHEMAHIRLYFKDDTYFSESIASFIQKYAAQSYLENILHKKLVAVNQKQLKKEYSAFNQIIIKTKNQLHQLFQSDLTREKKLKQKKLIYQRLKRQLQKMSQKNIYMKHSRLLKLKEINNAVLLQIDRYTPPRRTGLNILFKKTCREDFDCWFNQLEQLKECKPNQRKRIIREKIEIKKVLAGCKKN